MALQEALPVIVEPAPPTLGVAESSWMNLDQWALEGEVNPVHMLGTLAFMGKVRQLRGLIFATSDGSPHQDEIAGRLRFDLDSSRAMAAGARDRAVWEAVFQFKLATGYFRALDSGTMTRPEADRRLATGLNGFSNTYFGSHQADSRRAAVKRQLNPRAAEIRAAYYA